MIVVELKVGKVLRFATFYPWNQKFDTYKATQLLKKKKKKKRSS